VIVARLSSRNDEDPCPRMKEGVAKWHCDKSWVVDDGYKMKNPSQGNEM